MIRTRIKGDTYAAGTGIIHCSDCHNPVSGCDCAGKNVVMIDGFPRRNDVLQHTNEEQMIWAALQAVESIGAHPLLTQCSMLLSEAKDRLSDYIELPPHKK